MRKLFVFDLDDTLMDNVHDYAQPILDMAKTVIDKLGSKAPHVSLIIALEEELDKRRVHEINPDTGREFLYSMERFPNSLVETYNVICLEAGIKPKDHVQKEIYEIGMQAFNPARYVANINPETNGAVYFLRRMMDVTMLLSKGDKRVQSNKLFALRAGKLFQKIMVVDNKTPEIFAEMVDGFDPYTKYSVGNDYEKDIVPAMKVGFKGILIPVESWETLGRTDEILAKVDRSRCLVLNNLGDLKERYGEL